MTSVKAGETKQWTQTFILEAGIKAGDYLLLATQGMFTPDAKYSWELPAKPIPLKIVE